jgi:hypothetical protein
MVLDFGRGFFDFSSATRTGGVFFVKNTIAIASWTRQKGDICRGGEQ